MVRGLCGWWVWVVVVVVEGSEGSVVLDGVGDWRGWERLGRWRRMEVKDWRSMVCGEQLNLSVYKTICNV